MLNVHFFSTLSLLILEASRKEGLCKHEQVHKKWGNMEMTLTFHPSGSKVQLFNVLRVHLFPVQIPLSTKTTFLFVLSNFMGIPTLIATGFLDNHIINSCLQDRPHHQEMHVHV